MRSGIFFLAFLAPACSEAPTERTPEPEPIRLTVDDDGRVSYRGAVRTDGEIEVLLDKASRLLDLQHPHRPGCFGSPEASPGIHVDLELPRSVPRARRDELLAMIDAHEPDRVTQRFTGWGPAREDARIEFRLDERGVAHYRGVSRTDDEIGTVVDRANALLDVHVVSGPSSMFRDIPRTKRPSPLRVDVVAPMSVSAERIREVCEIISWQHPKEIRVTLRRGEDETR